MKNDIRDDKLVGQFKKGPEETGVSKINQA